MERLTSSIHSNDFSLTRYHSGLSNIQKDIIQLMESLLEQKAKGQNDLLRVTHYVEESKKQLSSLLSGLRSGTFSGTESETSPVELDDTAFTLSQEEEEALDDESKAVVHKVIEATKNAEDLQVTIKNTISSAVSYFHSFPSYFYISG